MKVAYDAKIDRFVLPYTNKQALFLGESYLLQPCDKINCERMSMRRNQSKIGPLIGVLVSQNKQNKLICDLAFLQRLQQQLSITGGLICLYTLKDVGKSDILGLFYSVQSNTWRKTTFPLPDIVYNRISRRSEEQTDTFISHKKQLQEQHIPFFNPGFINKFDFIQLCTDIPGLKDAIPDTVKLTNKEAFQSFLEKHKDVYCKPIKGSKGNGIFVVSELVNKVYQVTASNNISHYASIDDLWQQVLLSIIDKEYILQQAIDSKTIEGNKYDYRVLVQKLHLTYRVTGIGIRLASNQHYTTHTLHGGTVYPYEKIANHLVEQKIRELSKQVGEALQKQHVHYLEFTIDMGLDHSQKLWMYEVNIKPMTFDEEKIEHKRMKILIHQWYELSGFNSTK